MPRDGGWGELVRVQAMGEVRGFIPDRWFFHYVNIPWSKGEAEGHSDCLQEIKPSAPGSHLPPAIHDDNSRGLNQRALPGMGWGVGGGGEGMPRRAVSSLGSVGAESWDPGEEGCGHAGVPGARPGPAPPALNHKLLGNLPGELASSEMAIARRLLIHGLFQIQIPDNDARPKVKVLMHHI